MAFSTSAATVPPYAPHWQGWGALPEFLGALSFDNFRTLLSDSLYIDAYLSAVWLSALSTVLCLLIGFPLGWAISRAPRRWQPALLIAVVLPFWTSFLIRVYAWIAILRPSGVLDQFLMGLGITASPLNLMNTQTAVLIGMVYSYLPFMVLPIYASLERMDETLLEAAADLGAPPLTRFWRIVVPLALPGILAGSFLCFIPMVGDFVIPDLLGGPETLMIGKVLWQEFFSNRDWPLASAAAVALLVLLVGPIMLFQHIAGKRA
jgi:putrescine transport system permease protein